MYTNVLTKTFQINFYKDMNDPTILTPAGSKLKGGKLPIRP